jgi:hypothetical protein
MNRHLERPLVIGRIAAACLVLAAPAYAYDRHPPLRDDGAAWAARQAEAQPPPAQTALSDRVTLGEIPEADFQRQLGVAGHVMQLRAVTLAPGGRYEALGGARHPAGFLIVTGGEWTETLPGMGGVHSVTDAATILTGLASRHFVNRGAVPATAVSVEIRPSVDLAVSE